MVCKYIFNLYDLEICSSFFKKQRIYNIKNFTGKYISGEEYFYKDTKIIIILNSRSIFLNVGLSRISNAKFVVTILYIFMCI